MTIVSGSNLSVFRSHDLGLVACLLAKDFSLDGIEISDSKRALFSVKQKTGLQDAIDDYWSSKCFVDAQTYFNQLKRLKNQIYSS